MIESWPVLIFLFILLLFFAWGVVGLMSRVYQTRENRKIAENKLAELTKKKEIFTADVAKLGSEKGIEESIRERFPVVKEGEGLIVVVDEKNPPEVEENSSGGFFSFLKFWNWFK